VPAIAGVVFTGGGHVSTIENLFHFPAPARRHHLARGHPRGQRPAGVDRRRQRPGRAGVAAAPKRPVRPRGHRPAAAVVLLSGLVLVAQNDISLGEFPGRMGSNGSLHVPGAGATLLRVTNAELRRLATATTADNSRWPRLQWRAAILDGHQPGAAAVGGVGDGLQVDL
jgi:hypothetical protein